MNIYTDKRIVLTLDAGGTNFVFSAMQGGKQIVEPVQLPSNAAHLEKCLKTVIQGFETVSGQLGQAPEAISFAFPGPADYNLGIIGDLPNFPSFKGGVALGPMLEEKFNLPVFIKNDGDLYAYGEALAGILPEVNRELEDRGLDKRFNNLIGLTLGTGFGAGLVSEGRLLSGDNCVPAEVWNIANSISPEQNTEEGVSTRAILRYYRELSGEPEGDYMPRDIYQIAKGEISGNREAATQAYQRFGIHLGDAIANLIMLFDGIVVIGGGLTGAKELYIPSVFEVLKGCFKNNTDRLIHEVYFLDDDDQKKSFYDFEEVKVRVPFSEKEVKYYPVSKTALATSRLGASEAIAIGAYALALSKLDK